MRDYERNLNKNGDLHSIIKNMWLSYRINIKNIIATKGQKEKKWL